MLFWLIEETVLFTSDYPSYSFFFFPQFGYNDRCMCPGMRLCAVVNLDIMTKKEVRE